MAEEVKSVPQDDSEDTSDGQTLKKDTTVEQSPPIEPEGEKERVQATGGDGSEAAIPEEPPVEAQGEDQPVPKESVAEKDTGQAETQEEEATAASDTPPEGKSTAEDESKQPKGDEQEAHIATAEETEDQNQAKTQDEEQPAEKDAGQVEASNEETTDVGSIAPQAKGKVISFYRRLSKKTLIVGTGISLLIAGSIGFTVAPGLRSTDTITSTFLGGRPDAAYDMKFFLPLDVGYEKTQFVKVTVALELTDEGLQKEIEENLSQLRKEVIDLILTKSPKEVKSSAGKKVLRREITTRINSYLLKDCIKDTYFTELVIL